MSEFSNYLENAIIDHFIRGISQTSPATRYIALYSTNPGEDNSGTELVGNGYERQSASFGPPADGVSNLDLEIQFSSSADWDTATHFGILDAYTGGNLLMYSALSSSVDVSGGSQRIVFESGSLTVTVT